MVYQGIVFALALTVSVGTALYYLYNQAANQRAHTYGRNSNDNFDNWFERPAPASPPAATPRRRRNSNQNENCSICFEAISAKKQCKLKCSHRFHFDCIVEWIESKRSCPNCRAPVHIRDLLA